MSDAAYNIFGAVAGALGLIGLLPFICLVVKCQLPIAKAKELDDILADTKEFLLFVVEEGHLTDEAFAYEVGGDLDRHQDRANELKIEAYRDDGYVSQLKGMLTGLSWRIYAIFRQVRKIRSTISRKAFEDKHKRKSVIRSILPALRRASTGSIDEDDVAEKLNDVADSSGEATPVEAASPDESDISRDTRDPPAYCTVLENHSRNIQYTEELQTNDEDAVAPDAAAVATEADGAPTTE